MKDTATTKKKKPRKQPPPPDVRPKRPRHQKIEPPPNSLQTDLIKRRGYSLLRLLILINAAGKHGISTRKLLDTIGSHAKRHQELLDYAEDHELIRRIDGSPPSPGQFFPIYNMITQKGKELLIQNNITVR